MSAPQAIQRFPPPEFTETGHVLPGLDAPPARGLPLEVLDVAVLASALGLAVWLSLRARSRRGLVWLGLFSLAYFGFWRKGCVCSIGSIQNVAQALTDPGYAIPFSVLAFALLPLLTALFFGRAFCAGVCPHGALQDLMLIKPIQLPGWLERGLRLIAQAYLALALVVAASGGGYLICEYDPFVPIFRLGGSTPMVVTGIVLLALGLFVGRPYCRFLCPYGVLLGLAAGVSRRRVTVTPDTCTQCRLCEQSCPFGALHPSTLDPPRGAVDTDKRRLIRLVALLPLLVAAGILLGGGAGRALAGRHRAVALSERLHLEDSGAASDRTDASAAFRATGAPVDALHAEARQRVDRFVRSGRLAGGWVGLAAGCTLLSQAVRRRRRDYEADRMYCLSCARCFRACPQELKRLGLPTPPPPAPAAPGSA